MKLVLWATALAVLSACGSGSQKKEEIVCRLDAYGNQICTVYKPKEVDE